MENQTTQVVVAQCYMAQVCFSPWGEVEVWISFFGVWKAVRDSPRLPPGATKSGMRACSKGSKILYDRGRCSPSTGATGCFTSGETKSRVGDKRGLLSSHVEPRQTAAGLQRNRTPHAKASRSNAEIWRLIRRFQPSSGVSARHRICDIVQSTRRSAFTSRRDPSGTHRINRITR